MWLINIRSEEIKWSDDANRSLLSARQSYIHARLGHTRVCDRVEIPEGGKHSTQTHPRCTMVWGNSTSRSQESSSDAPLHPPPASTAARQSTIVWSKSKHCDRVGKPSILLTHKRHFYICGNSTSTSLEASSDTLSHPLWHKQVYSNERYIINTLVKDRPMSV